MVLAKLRRAFAKIPTQQKMPFCVPPTDGAGRIVQYRTADTARQPAIRHATERDVWCSGWRGPPEAPRACRCFTTPLGGGSTGLPAVRCPNGPSHSPADLPIDFPARAARRLPGLHAPGGGPGVRVTPVGHV